MGKQLINRYYWLDVTKFIGIFLIVLCHLPISWFLQKFLWTFHVPLFFFISGFLFKEAEAKLFLQKLSARLVLPYIYVYVVCVVLTMLIKADYDPQHSLNRLLGLFWGTHRYPDFVNSALWFLPGLMTVQVLYFFGVQKQPLLYFVLLAVSVFWYQNHYLNLFFSIDLALLGLNFFIAGVLVKKHAYIDKIRANTRWVAALFVVSLLVTVDFAASGNVWYAGPHYSFSLLGGLMGITMVITLSLLVETYFKPSALIVYISSSTLCIFCFHLFSNPLAEYLVKHLAIPVMIVNSLLATVLSILFLLPVNWLIERYIPELIGVKRVKA